MNRRFFSSDIRSSFLVAVVGAALYISLLSINYDSNGIGTARGIESGAVTSANHMFFEMTGLAVLRTAEFFGHTGPSFRLLQTLAAIWGGLALGGTYLAARGIGAHRLAALTATVWLGATWSFWTWSTNVAYVGMATMLVAVSVALFWRANSTLSFILPGIVAALSVLAWEANIFLVPVLLAGIWLQPESLRERIKRSMCVAGACGITLGIVYVVVARHGGIRDVQGIFSWLRSYGRPGSSHVSSWGRWGWDRFGALAQTWTHSILGSVSLAPEWIFARPIRFDTVFPRLAPIACGIFILVPFVVFFRHRRDRFVLWCLMGGMTYLLFALWWDPFETKWLLIPNVFIALLASRLWSQVESRKWVYYFAPVAVAVLFVSNFSLYAIPEHLRLSDENQIGECVGSHLAPSDQYIATDWAFGGYMSYKYSHESIDLIGTSAWFGFEKAQTFQDIGQKIRDWQQAGAVYVTDPSSSPAERFELLKSTTGITQSEVDREFPGTPAFNCMGWPIRKINSAGEFAEAWESIGDVSTFSLPAGGGIYAILGNHSSTSLQGGTLAIQTKEGPSPPVAALIESDLVTQSKMFLSGQPPLREGLLWLDNASTRRSAVAFVNPRKTPIDIQWYITGRLGHKEQSGSVHLDPGASLARYADEEPFRADLKSAGFLRFSTPDGVIATSVIDQNVKGRVFSDSLAARNLESVSIPVQIISFLEAGNGKETTILLSNPSAQTLSGSVEIIDDHPNDPSGSLTQTISYSIPAQGIWEHRVQGPARGRTGWLRVGSSEGNNPLVLAEIEDQNNAEPKMMETSDGTGNRLWLYGGRTDSPQTKLRIINPGVRAVSAQISMHPFGRPPNGMSTVEIPARSSVVLDTASISGAASLPVGLHTVVDVNATGGVLASVVLEKFDAERAAIVAANFQNNQPKTTIPRIVFGSGYRTTLMIDAARSKSGAWMDFRQASGEALKVPLSQGKVAP